MIEQRPKIKDHFLDDDIYDIDEESGKSSKIPELEKDGDIAVDVALDGTEVLARLREKRYDVVVLDIMMPPGTGLPAGDTKQGKETGFLVLKEIRKDWPLDPAIIVLTLYPKIPSEADMESFNIQEYLPKPIKMRELASLIRRYAKESENARKRNH